MPAQTVLAQTPPAIAIVIDDLGNNPILDRRALHLPGRITASILPFTPQAQKDAKLAREHGLEVILHLPMQAENGKAMGEGGLDEHLTESEFKRTVARDIATIPGIAGISNHMGSRLTRNPQAMKWLMQSLKNHPLFFLDSRTAANSVAADTAHDMNIPALNRDVFLDNIRDTADIEHQFDRMIDTARKRGQAIAIGHPYPETLAVLERRMPELGRQGVRLVTLTDLVKLP